jgi:hypothetical protein
MQVRSFPATFPPSDRLGDSTSEPATDPAPAVRPRPRSLRGVLALGAGLTVLLALVAAASRGDRAAPARGEGPSDAVWDYLLSTYLVLGVVTFVALVYVLAKERESLPTRRTTHRDIRQLLQFAAVIVVLFLIGPRLAALFREHEERGGTTPVQTRASDREGKRREPGAEARGRREFRWAPVIVLSAFGAATIAVVLVTRARRREELPRDEFAGALADVLDDALADLRAERDPRRAIIAAYARMERLLGAHGVPRRPSEAPFEYLGRVLVELRANVSSVFELTALFERAKFSRHRIDGGMRDEAIAALVAVRDELRGPA